MNNKIWIISNYYPKIVNEEEVKTNPVFEWTYIDISKFINIALGETQLNHQYVKKC